MVEYFAKRSLKEEIHAFKKPLVSSMLILARHSTLEELHTLAETYDLNPHILRDVRDMHELPRVELSGDCVYVFLRVPTHRSATELHTAPILVVLHPQHLFLFTQTTALSVNDLSFHNHTTTPSHNPHHLISVLEYALRLFDSQLEHIEVTLTHTASQLQTHAVSSKDLLQFMNVDDGLTRIKSNATALINVLERLRTTHHPLLLQQNIERLDDTELYARQLLGTVERLHARTNSIRVTYSTISNTTLNNRMKTLTVFTVLITLPNIFFSMFGMNVILPLSSESSAAYWQITTSAVVLTFCIYIIAKKFRLF